jgi:tetratricopeptide (TPR) repeat protein
MEIAEDTSAAAIVRATALEMLGGVADEAIAERSAALLADPNVLIRENAIGLQRGASPADHVRRLVPLLEDPLRSVRVSAARSLIGVPIIGLPETSFDPYRTAMADFRSSLSSKTDFPEAHLVLGGVALVMRNPSAAEAAFREAVTLDPQLEEAWSMIVQIRIAVGDREGARDVLTEARGHNPSSLMLIQLDLGLRD